MGPPSWRIRDAIERIRALEEDFCHPDGDKLSRDEYATAVIQECEIIREAYTDWIKEEEMLIDYRGRAPKPYELFDKLVEGANDDLAQETLTLAELEQIFKRENKCASE